TGNFGSFTRLQTCLWSELLLESLRGRAKRRRRIRYHALERGFDRARSIAGRRRGAGEIVPHLLVAPLRIREAQWLWAGRSAGSHARFLRFVAGAARS